MTDHQMFQNSFNYLELGRPKDRDHLIPPIIPQGRNESEIEDSFQSATTALFAANDNMPSIGQLTNRAFHPVGPTPDAMTSSGVNVMPVPHPVFSSVGSYIPASINTMTPCLPFVTTQNGWPMPPAQPVPALPSAATMTAITSTHNPALVIESPQLRAALTMNCLPTQHFADPYSNILNHHHGVPTSYQPTNFIPFPPIPVGVHATNGMNPDTGSTHSHQRQHIEINEIKDSSCDIEQSGTNLREPPRRLSNHQHHAATLLVEDHDNMVTSTSTLSSPERQLTPPSPHPTRGDARGAIVAESDDSLEPAGDSLGAADENTKAKPQLGKNRNRSPANKKISQQPMKRQIVDEDEKDNKYFEKRKRNNESAKRSRDARKDREENVNRRADFLERENSVLKAQVATLREEANSLRQLLSQRPMMPSMMATEPRIITTHQLP